MAWNRVTNKAVILPAANNSSKPIYVPAHTKFAVFFGDHTYLIPTEIMVSDVPIVFSSCIVEQTCGVLMVTSHFASSTFGLIDWFTFFPSTRIRSWSLPGWKIAQIFNPEPFHILPFQCRTSYLSRTTSIPPTFQLTWILKKPLLISISQFAYHEATYFLVRLLQQFTGFALEQSENLKTPAEWAGCDGLKGTEKVFPASHLTMYIKVCGAFIGTNGIRTSNLVCFSLRAVFGYGWNHWSPQSNEL